MNARANTTIAREFLSLNARYCIDPSSEAGELACDAGCLLEGVIHTIQAVIDGMSDKTSDMAANAERQVPCMLFGIKYQLEMVKNIAETLEHSTFIDTP